MSKYCPNKHYPVWCDLDTKRQWCYPKSETPNDPAQFCKFRKDTLIRQFMESERITRGKNSYRHFSGKTPTKQRSKWTPPLPPLFHQSARVVDNPLEQLFMEFKAESQLKLKKIERLTIGESENSIDTRTALFDVKSKNPLILTLEMGDELTIYPFTSADEQTLLEHIEVLAEYAPKEEVFEMLWMKARLNDGTIGLVNAKNAYIENRIAMFSYDAASKDELSFKGGDYLHIQDKSKGDWWLACTVKNPAKSGYVPSNYLAICVTSPVTTADYKKNSHVYIQSNANGTLEGTNEAGDTFLIDESLLLYPRCDEDDTDQSDREDENIKREAEAQIKVAEARKRRRQVTATWKKEMKPAGSINELVFGLPGI